MELKVEGIEMQKLNIPTDRASRVDKKVGSCVCLSCLLSELWS